MNVLDAIILLILILFAFRGFRNGFIKEAFGLAGIAIACFVAFHYMHPVARYIASHLSLNESFIHYLPYFCVIVLFLITLIVVELLIFLLTRLIEAVALGLPNQLLGLVIGGLKAGILISVVLLILAGFNEPSPQSRKESLLYPSVIMLAPAAFDVIAWIYPGAKDFRRTIEQTIYKNNPPLTLSLSKTTHGFCACRRATRHHWAGGNRNYSSGRTEAET